MIDSDLSNSMREAFDKALEEPAEEKPDQSPHKWAVDRAQKAKALAEAEGISIGQAIVKVMEEEYGEDFNEN